jgi:hypothetical protein
VASAVKPYADHVRRQALRPCERDDGLVVHFDAQQELGRVGGHRSPQPAHLFDVVGQQDPGPLAVRRCSVVLAGVDGYAA